MVITNVMLTMILSFDKGQLVRHQGLGEAACQLSASFQVDGFA
jgi:hypothetical protein